jgi:glycosyltransferase involved in cell wall biosynthesis
MQDHRLHVLVIPHQFPRTEGDIGGIFVLDYIDALKPFCEVSVLMPGYEPRAGMTRLPRAPNGILYVTCTPRLRGGVRRARFGRMEVLHRMGRAAPFLPNVDLIHAHGAVFHGLPAATLGRKLGVPVVLTVHTGPFNKLLRRATTRWLTRRTLERVDCVCPVSNDLLHQIENAGITPKRTEVTYNPVDTDLFRPSAREETRRQRITFAGRLEEYKGGLRVAKAFAEIASRWPGWTLSIGGDGPERPAIQAFLDNNPALNGRVDLLGGYTKTELADLLTRSDFFVYPSRHETFGLVLAEAMSAGLPVIGPNCTAPPEYIDARSGLLVPPDDVLAIAGAMEQMLQNFTRYDRDAIRERVVERFGFASFGRRLLDTYRSLVGTPNHRDPTCAGSRV